MKKPLAALLALGMLASLAACQVTVTLPNAAGDAASSAADGGISNTSPAPDTASPAPAPTPTGEPAYELDEAALWDYLDIFCRSVYVDSQKPLSCTSVIDPVLWACGWARTLPDAAGQVRIPLDTAASWCELLFQIPLDAAQLAALDGYRYIFAGYDAAAQEILCNAPAQSSYYGYMADPYTLSWTVEGNRVTVLADIVTNPGGGYSFERRMLYHFLIRQTPDGVQYYQLEDDFGSVQPVVEATGATVALYDGSVVDLALYDTAGFYQDGPVDEEAGPGVVNTEIPLSAEQQQAFLALLQPQRWVVDTVIREYGLPPPILSMRSGDGGELDLFRLEDGCLIRLATPTRYQRFLAPIEVATQAEALAAALLS